MGEQSHTGGPPKVHQEENCCDHQDIERDTKAIIPDSSYSSIYKATIDFCKKVDAKFIVRGVRNTGDFEFEKAIARTNRFLSRIETIFILTSAKTSFISSSIVRDLINNNGQFIKMVPDSVSNFVLNIHFFILVIIPYAETKDN